MNYLITGGAGFIGSNIVDFLIKQDHTVIVIDNLSSDAHDNFYFNNNAIYYKYDILDYIMCSDVFNKHKPDVVLHLAAEARIQNCILDPIKAFEVNSLGTVNLLELSKKYKVKRLVLSSTSAIYGLKNTIQIETAEPDCLNPYALSKLSSEQWCKLYSKNYNIDTVCLRYFNVYGPRNPSKGQYAPVIGVFKKQKEEGNCLTIVGDGDQTRDFIHVDDVVEINYLASISDKNFNGEIFNVGTGKSYSINNIAYKIQQDKHKHVYLPQRCGEARHTCANIEKTSNWFGWSPSVDLINWLDIN